MVRLLSEGVDPTIKFRAFNYAVRKFRVAAPVKDALQMRMRTASESCEQPSAKLGTAATEAGEGALTNGRDNRSISITGSQLLASQHQESLEEEEPPK